MSEAQKPIDPAVQRELARLIERLGPNRAIRLTGQLLATTYAGSCPFCRVPFPTSDEMSEEEWREATVGRPDEPTLHVCNCCYGAFELQKDSQAASVFYTQADLGPRDTPCQHRLALLGEDTKRWRQAGDVSEEEAKLHQRRREVQRLRARLERQRAQL